MRSSLLSRLKPEFKQGLEDNKTKYPASINDLEFVLGQITFYNDLTVNQVLNLFLFSDMEYRDRKSFDWRFGDDAFELENNAV
jgi:hypothetical protein